MRRGFTVLELIVAMGIFSVLALTVTALAFSTLRANTKGSLTQEAEALAEAQLQKAIYQAQCDSPPGSAAQFWDTEGIVPPGQLSVSVGPTEYQYILYANTVPSVGGPGNRLKKVDLVMWWWTSEADAARQGYGDLTVRATRLVSEADRP